MTAHDQYTGSIGDSQPYRYVGRLGYYTHYQDQNMDLLQLGVRFYDPEIGRFTQKHSRRISMSPETPIYECRRVPSGSIRIDGRLDDPGWGMVEPLGDFIVSDGSGSAVRKTTARICWDETFLYISFECEDPDIWGTMFHRDDPIYDEEVVEAFIDPDSDLVRYYELQTSPHNTLFDALIDIPTGDRSSMTTDLSWTCEGWLSAVQVDGTLDNRDDLDAGWTVEWAIPFASIPGAPHTPPRDGDTWRINLYRIDRTPEPEFSCWSPTLDPNPNFHIPSRFGTIVFRE